MTSAGLGDMLVIVPTRGRPQNVLLLNDAWHDTACGAADMIYVVDEDDPKVDTYTTLNVSGSMRVVPRKRLGPTLNDIAMEFAPQYSYLGFMGDDHRPRTPMWDRTIVNALWQLQTGVVYGNDLVHGEAIPTAWFMTSDIVESLGYMVPPGLIHLFLDNFIKDLGSELGRIRYLPNIVIEHMHPLVDKAPQDAGYAEVNSPEMWSHDQTEYDRYVSSGEFVEAANRVAEACDI